VSPVTHIPSLNAFRTSAAGGSLSSHRGDGQGHGESKDVTMQRPKPKPKAEPEWGEIVGMGFQFIQESGCESSFFFVTLFCSLFFFISVELQSTSSFRRGSSLPFLVILFVSRNVRLMPTVCSHRQLIFIGPVEVRGRVIEDDGLSYHSPLTFLYYAQVGCMPSFLVISPFYFLFLLYGFL
jgi:hypothetical protein